MGLVIHVVNHAVQVRGARLTPEDRDDLASEIFLNIIKDEFAVLRHFRGQSSLATYLTVVARRIVVRELLQQKHAALLGDSGTKLAAPREKADTTPEQRITDREEVERLLEELEEGEAKIVRLYHLEGKSYQEISVEVSMPENSIGPVLSRARSKMRRAGVNQAAAGSGG